MNPKTIQLDNEKYVKLSDAEQMVKSAQRKTAKLKQPTLPHPYEIGINWHVETATKYYLGTLEAVTDGELILSNAAWIPDKGRDNEYHKGTAPKEMEPIGDVVISRGSIVAAMPHKVNIEIVVR